MHFVKSTLYVDAGDTVQAHTHHHELRVHDRPGRPGEATFTIVLPTDPTARVEFLDRLGEQVATMRVAAYRQLASISGSELPTGSL